MFKIDFNFVCIMVLIILTITMCENIEVVWQIGTYFWILRHFRFWIIGIFENKYLYILVFSMKIKYRGHP